MFRWFEINGSVGAGSRSTDMTTLKVALTWGVMEAKLRLLAWMPSARGLTSNILCLATLAMSSIRKWASRVTKTRRS